MMLKLYIHNHEVEVLLLIIDFKGIKDTVSYSVEIIKNLLAIE